MTNPITVSEAAQRLGLTERQIRHLCKTGVIAAKPFGRAWLITDISKAKSRPRVGRPRKA